MKDPGVGQVARLFPDYEKAEREYYRRTGIFPLMHVVAIRKELAQRPGLVQAIYRAFSEAKEIPAQQYRHGAAKQHMTVMTPWFSELFAENRRLLGEDWWPSGVGANRKALFRAVLAVELHGADRERLAGADRRHLDPSNVTSLTSLYVYPPWVGHTLLVRNSQGPQGGHLDERHPPAAGVRHHRRRRRGCP